jgi:GMC oxidoreductase/DDE superfamily endonuclease
MLALGVLGGDSDVGDERQEWAPRLRDNPWQPYCEHNSLNHTMVYLAMGHDDAKGTLYLRTNGLDPNGKLEIDWDDAGRQLVFTRINEELRRHAQALGAHFIANHVWDILNTRRLLTAHPLGGCLLGEDHLHGAVDEFGRVFAADGRIHEGLFVADGSLIPSALGVNPFLTISAICERIADRLVGHLRGEPYRTRAARVTVPEIDPLTVVTYVEPVCPKGDPDPKAVCGDGWRRPDTNEGWLRCVAGRPVSHVTTAFLAWVCERLARAHKRGLVLIWDHAFWHRSQEVRHWIRAHTQQPKQAGSIRLLVCRLPVKSPWLNPIEPRWVHSKRAIVEPAHLLTTAEVISRVCDYFEVEPLTQKVA